MTPPTPQPIDAKALAGAPFFTVLADEQRLALALLFEPVPLAAGQVLFAQGQRREALYLLLDGEIEVHEQAHGGPHRLATLHAGTVLGET